MGRVTISFERFDPPPGYGPSGLSHKGYTQTELIDLFTPRKRAKAKPLPHLGQCNGGVVDCSHERARKAW